MALLPENEQTTLAAIDRAIAAKPDDGLRPHLGASLIGRPCERELWYTFRWASARQISPRIQRLFDRGHREEPVLVGLLRAAGVTVATVDPQTCQQYRFSAFGGHVGGSQDGAGKGFTEAPKTWHVCEFKTHNAKSFGELRKKGVREAKPEHWAQCQLYMHWSGCERAFYLAVNKDDDDLYSERIKYDREAAEQLLARAQRIVEAKEPPVRISDDPAWYLCKRCDHHATCHTNRLPVVSCRTCAHSTPEQNGDGRWSCARWQGDVPLEFQKQGCDEHRYIPILISYARVADASQSENWIEYELPDGRRFRNGIKATGSYTSRELSAMPSTLLSHPDVDKIREQFGAEAAQPNKQEENA